MPERHDGDQATMVYQRLMMAGFFPDGLSAALTLVVPTSDVNIKEPDEAQRAAITDIDPPGFDPANACFEKITRSGA